MAIAYHDIQVAPWLVALDAMDRNIICHVVYRVEIK
jgi:hypothetical protein